MKTDILKIKQNKHNLLNYFIDLERINDYSNKILNLIDENIEYHTKQQRSIRDFILQLFMGNYRLIWDKKNPIIENNTENDTEIQQNNEFLYNKCVYCKLEWKLPIIHIMTECKKIQFLFDENEYKTLKKINFKSLLLISNKLYENQDKLKFKLFQ